MTVIALAYSVVLAVVAVLAVAAAVVGVTVAVRRNLVGLLVWLLYRVTDLGMATAVLVTGEVCRHDPNSSLISTLLWAAIASAVSGLALNVPGWSLAGRAWLLADRLCDATTPQHHDATDQH